MSEPGPPSAGRDIARTTTAGKIAVVLGLVALAFVQPLFDLMGRNPAFFVAGQYSRGQIVTFGLAVVLVPAAVLTALTVVTCRLGRVGDVVFLLLIAALGALFGNVVARGTELDGGKVAVIASVLGAAATVGLYQLRAGRKLLQYLAAANILFLVSFLLLSPTSKLVAAESSSDLGHVSVPELPGPVVVVVFDELPLSVIVNGDGEINAERYPAFAELSDSSTWYRNASSDHYRTERAVPELMTGTQPKVSALPSYVDLPRNILTLFADDVPVDRYEAVTDMCPPTACESRGSGSLVQMVRDAAVVYGHRVLPARLRTDLPAIDQAWGQFGGTVGGSGPVAPECKEEGRLKNYFCKSAQERGPAGQAAALAQVGARIEDGTPSLHFAHVILPHRSYILTPWGTSVMGSPPEVVTDASDPAFDWSRRLFYQRASLQFGAADAVLGGVFDGLKDLGVWDETTIVVMADHGVSLLPPIYGRDEVTEANREEVYRVPLFMKAAGQTADDGKVVDDPASTLDMLPTLIDMLDIETDWSFDGHSLLDGSQPTVEPTVDPSVQPLFDLVARHDADIPAGYDWEALAKVGERADLVGRPLGRLSVGSDSDLRWAADGQDQFGDLPTDAGEAPQTLNGSVRTPDGSRPPELVVAVNGTIGGSIGGYSQTSDGWRFGTVLGPYLVDGANEITAYEVDDDGVLHALP